MIANGRYEPIHLVFVPLSQKYVTVCTGCHYMSVDISNYHYFTLLLTNHKCRLHLLDMFLSSNTMFVSPPP